MTLRHALLAAALSAPALCLALALAPLPALAQGGAPVEQGPRNAPDLAPAFPGQTRAPARDSGVRLEAETLASGLVHPWGVAVLPDGALLVTERAGRLRVLSTEGVLSDPLAGVPEVLAQRQGGLLDVSLAPDFADSRRVCLTYAKPVSGGSATAAACGTLSADRSRLEGVADIFVQTPPSRTSAHYGSRILFDGEGHVFITTGEHFTRSERRYAQDLDKTYGKILRLTESGAPAPGNPFADRPAPAPQVWSYGHRNIQGAAFRQGRLWAVEHGPRGGDELNRIEAGANYGWPVISYGVNYSGSDIGEGIAREEGMAQPVYFWDPVIAPGGMLFYRADMFPDWRGDALIASLSPGGLVRLEMEGDRVTGEERLLRDVGRVRDVETDAEGALLILTDSPEGRILRLTPAE